MSSFRPKGVRKALVLLVVQWWLSPVSGMGQETPPKPMPEVQVLVDEARAAHGAGKYEEALKRFRATLDKAREQKDMAGEAIALNGIGASYSMLGAIQTMKGGPPQEALVNLQKALEYLQMALPLFRRIGDVKGESKALNNLGNIYSRTAQLSKAIEFYQQGLTLDRALRDKKGEAESLFNLSRVYREMGQPHKTMECCQQARPLFQSVGDSLGEAGVIMMLGTVYEDTDQPQNALEYFQLALSIYQTLGHKWDEARTLRSLGMNCQTIGSFQKAMEYLQQALPLLKAVGDKRVEALALNSIGIVYWNLGQLQQARDYYQQAYTLYRTIGDKRGQVHTLMNFGSCYYDVGQPQMALQSYKKALSLSRAVGYKRGESSALGNIGVFYARTGQPQQALKYYHQALRLDRQTNKKSDAAQDLYNIGGAYLDTGRPGKALEYYQQAFTFHQAIGDRKAEALTLSQIALAEQKLHRTADAEAHFAQSIALLETLRADLGGYSEAKTSFLASNLYIYYEYLTHLLEHGKTEQAFEVAQKTKARSLLDTLAYGRVDLSSVLAPEERTQEQELRQLANFLNSQMVKEGVENEVGAKERFAELQKKLRETESQLQTFTDTLYARHPDLAQKRAAKTATLQDIARFLTDDTALLEYVAVSNTELRLFVVTTRQGKTVLHSYPIKVRYRELAKQCAAFRTACADPRKPYRTLARRVYRLLLAPAEKQLSGKKRLVVCPDGPLWDVPFQALLDRENRSLWERYELSFAYSATGAQAVLAARQIQRPFHLGSVLALANPDFGSSQRFGHIDNLPGQRPFEMPSRPFEMPSRPFEMPSRQMASLTRGGRIASLPGTQKEADALKKTFPDAAIYTGKQAQEAIVKAEAGKYRYLHFATHGFLNDASPLLSSIVLAEPEKQSGEDGFLTAREVFEMQLNAELVVLSACNTGRGQARTGEGIVGLTWALFVAGCPTQVVSLWAVDDAATATLMAGFYQGLKAGKGKAEALRSVALKLRQDSKHAHPYYWSPFFLMGDWR